MSHSVRPRGAIAIAIVVPLLAAAPAGHRLAGQRLAGPMVTTVALAPAEATAGGGVRGTVTLDSSAEAGTLVSLTSSRPAVAAVPGTVRTAPREPRVAAFAVTTAAPGCAKLEARVGRTPSRTVWLPVHPPPPAATSRLHLELADAQVRGGTPTVLLVTYTPPPAEPGPSLTAGGVAVALTSDSPAATVPRMATVPSPEHRAKVIVSTPAVPEVRCAVLTASMGSTSSASVLLQVTP